MAADAVKDRIQSAYRQLLESRQLIPRYGQRQMIAEITNCLAPLLEGEAQPAPVCVVEAGTGTGKTLAYLLAVLPLARELDMKVVVATATVALQEQVVGKDIPEILAGSDLQFSFALAKGRGRYLCLSRLDTLLRGSDSLQAMLDLYGEDLDSPDGDNRALYQAMLDALGSGEWQGDRDDWQQPLTERQWRPLTVDRYQCSGARCSHFRNCCFFKARNSLDRVDCIVANHDLVLTDLALGGGAILPEPENCLYIFDEAHHLPLKSNSHFSAFTRLRASLAWLERCEGLAAALVKAELLEDSAQSGCSAQVNTLRAALEETLLLLEQLIESLDSVDAYDNRAQFAFELGQVPAELRQQAEQLSLLFGRFTALLEGWAEQLRQEQDSGSDLQRMEQAEQWLPVLGGHIQRAANSFALWQSYALPDQEQQAPSARWLTLSDAEAAQEGRGDIGLSVSPVLAAASLKEHLWERCGGAVLTSATLSSLGNFQMLQMRAGLPEHTRYLSIPSPFDFPQAASLVIPRMHCDPSDTQRHTEIISQSLPQLLAADCAALMLFSSRRQMLEVLQQLPADWRERVLCQDDYQKAQLLQYHRQRVDQGKPSLIFGLASFAEGVDLPGAYCTTVLIAKLPFAVPNDPVEMTLAAWVEQQGKNAFMTLAVPDAAFRLLQASGRLLRSETDRGRIILFDERIVTRRYGKQILESLPPYRREIFEQELAG